ncbi:MAG: hypothetical protein FH761_11050 [Firmicutes bacterium]|nr:hypothetical protein [Bacillota bacterium]
MTKIIISNMEFNTKEFYHDLIRSEFTNEKLIRIKCEISVKGREDNEKLKDILVEECFDVSVPEDDIQFIGREGEISYNYLADDVSKGDPVEFIYVLELIEYEEVEENIMNDESEELGYLTKIHKKLLAIEKLLIDKGIATKEEIDEIS